MPLGTELLRPWLVADIGGTNARFGWLAGDEPHVQHVHTLPTAGHAGLAEAASAYLGRLSASLGSAYQPPHAAAFAVATAVGTDQINFTNNGWSFSREATRQALGLNELLILNDFEALAWGAPVVPNADLAHLGGPAEGDPHSAIAVLGPGTGFGVSALARDIHGHEIAMPSEGGHACFAPGDPIEDEILRILRRRYDRVSIERLICGPGLLNMHRALAEIDGRETHIDDPAQITTEALEDYNSACGATLARFCAILGAVAGDIALTTGARGGVYIAGGIAPRILPFLKASPFRERFERKGRFQDYMAAIPTPVILHKHAALLGAARVAFAEAG